MIPLVMLSRFSYLKYSFLVFLNSFSGVKTQPAPKLYSSMDNKVNHQGVKVIEQCQVGPPPGSSNLYSPYIL